jgi:protein CpxP
MRSLIDHPGRLLATAALGALILAAPSHAQTSNQTTAPSQRQVAAKSATPDKTANHADRVEGRITELHTKLHITSEQEPKWTTFAQAMRDNAKRMDDVLAKRSQDLKAMTAVDDLRSYRDMTEVHYDNLKKLVSAFEPLYDSLTADQKKAADTMFAQAQTRQHAQKGKVAKGS